MVRDISVDEILVDYEPQPFTVSSNSQIYHHKDRQKVFKFRGLQREIDMMLLAGDCSIQPLERVLRNIGNVEELSGFTMKRETPLDGKTIEPTRKKAIMRAMIACVQALHEKGIVHGDVKLGNMLLCEDGRIRLCDFAEARELREDPGDWKGETTLNYCSPKRFQQLGGGYLDERYSAPVVEDDLFALGLSIWELWIGEVPFENVYYDDIHEMVSEGKTVDVERVEDQEVREIIWDYLSRGGATSIARYEPPGPWIVPENPPIGTPNLEMNIPSQPPNWNI
jgi:serine/threonine protein kinase